ncbi:MAG TPA: DNA/RNA nuclease SfsA [Lachnospiraceae bacterium]|nr:DNA/RNA nuclease SfsA [Lachnospiraceae bacterium]
MEYKNIRQAIFLKRPNRFIAIVNIDNQEETVHVKNTGRCKELLTEGAKVILEKSDNPKRKTRYSIIAVYKGNMLINMDSQVPNAVVAEALREGKILEIGEVSLIKREVTYSKSRFDIYYEKSEKKGFIEVKGVTLERDGVALFPDAPTIRGLRHVHEMIKAKQEGYEANLILLIQMDGIEHFMPNKEMDKEFASALSLANKKGVNIMAYNSVVKENSISIGKRIEIKL